jgi:hypothetical protein
MECRVVETGLRRDEMKESFRFEALPFERFASLFEQSDAELQTRGIRRMLAKPGYPCRVSLMDAEIGETVLLVPYTHHDVSSPYRASGPIFVRAGARTATPDVGEIPTMFAHRLLSVRAYDADAMMVDATVAHGSELQPTIGSLFADDRIAYLHVHNAGPGCYNCRVIRA